MEDNIWGGVRLNQLTEEEVRLRNEHMSNTVLRFRSDMSDEERNEASRAYYIGLASAQAANGKSSEAPAGSADLPFGWNERLSVTYSISDLQESRANQAIPQTNNSVNSDQYKLMSAACEDTKSAHRAVSRVRMEIKECLQKEEGPRTDLELSMLKEELEEATKEYTRCQEKENSILAMMMTK